MLMRLDDEVVRGMALGKAHKHFQAPLVSLSFHRTRDLLIAAEEETLYVYNAESGEAQRAAPVFCRKYGVSRVVWTHSPDDILHASAKNDSHAVRYLSLESNQYVLYFEGHSGRVTSLDMSPKNDTFLSAGLDNSVRLWDLRTPICQAVLQTPGAPVAAFDQQGLVFAVGAEGGVVKLYDAAQYAKGPFETFVVQDLHNRHVSFRQLLFSNDGNTLVAAAGDTAYVLDAFNGELQHAIRLGPAEVAAHSQVSLSYDGAYLIGGCDATGAVGVWSTRTGEQVAAWRDAAPDGTPRCVSWAPRRLMAASGNMMLALWIPGRQALERAMQQQPQ